jgi:hypothetical protein
MIAVDLLEMPGLIVLPGQNRLFYTPHRERIKVDLS